MFTTKETIRSFGGTLHKLQHASAVTKTPMDVNLFLPPSSGDAASAKLPVLFFLSGLTCSPNNCCEKGFLQAHAAEAGLALVWPDTSPRGVDVAGVRDSWDFGEAASFYVDATREPFAENFRMETYLVDELPRLLYAAFPQLDGQRVSIAGHSMGGHGALSLYLKHPGTFRSVSAFAPIANPTRCAWGRKAFAGYLGEGPSEAAAWAKHDATELVKGWKGQSVNALIDQGTADPWAAKDQLLLENFERAAKEASVDGLTVRYQEGYDHSYYFISTFGRDHIQHHAKFLHQ